MILNPKEYIYSLCVFGHRDMTFTEQDEMDLYNLFEDYICELIETSTQAEIESTQSINKLNMEQLNRDNKDEKDN